jgi:DNA-binding HxlR family transcriptional regulator
MKPKLLDLLAAKGSVEILTFLKSANNPITITEMSSHFQSQKGTRTLTTATLYRRVKELQLAGFITKNKAKQIVLTEFGEEKISDIQREEIRLKRSRRDILNVIQKAHSISVQDMQNSGFSPVTIQQSVEELKNLALVEQDFENKPVLKRKKVGRPKKLYRLTKKGKQILKKQEELEKELNK